MTYLIWAIIFLAAWLFGCLFFYAKWIAPGMEGTDLDIFVRKVCSKLSSAFFYLANHVLNCFGYVGRATLNFEVGKFKRRLRLLPSALKTYLIVILIWYYR